MTVNEFERCCTEHRRGLLSYLYALCRDYHQAEDLVQEAMAIAHGKREHYFPEADFGAWLRAIARNVWMRQRRIDARAPRHEAVIGELADTLFSADDYQDDRWGDEKRALDACLEQLESTDRRLIRDHFSGGQRYGELAAAAGRTVSWVKVRMFRARAALAECIRGRLAGGGNEA
jgi:RNA polymerase sigma-70 factor (ECF subfamily)